MPTFYQRFFVSWGGLFLIDIDVTMDYAGSFDREEVIDYMVTNHDFRCQGAVEDAAKTILKRKSFATILHPFFLQYGPCEDILMIISYVPAQ